MRPGIDGIAPSESGEPGNPEALPAELARYARQIRVAQIGIEGQRKLGAARVVVIGIGALGSAISTSLVRAGVGFLRLVDRDVVEMENLARQTLYDESDAAKGAPKAQAAAGKLREANRAVMIEAVVRDVARGNVLTTIEGCDLLLDGTDNIETRLLINDACLERRLPWIYGGVLGTSGCTMTFLPGDGPCFRCMVPTLPPPGSVTTTAAAGVLGTVPQAVAALQVTEALKLLTGQRGALVRQFRFLEIWEGTLESQEVSKGPAPCPACDLGRFEFLRGGA